jgi:hypothetical protein
MSDGDERETRAAMLLARMWNQLGRIADFDVETAEQVGDRERRIMRCTVKLYGDQHAPRWVDMNEDAGAWQLLSFHANGEISDTWANVVAAEGGGFGWVHWGEGPVRGVVDGDHLDAMIACLEDMTGAEAA